MANTPFDPQVAPVDALAGEAPLPAERLCAAWLQHRFANPPPDWIPEAFDVALHRSSGWTDAAVLVPLVLRADGMQLLLTRRTAHLTDHAGQISFPGGRTELVDASRQDTALRETEEEIGLARAHVEVLGTLPDYLTITGYRVTPVVGLIVPPFALAPDPGEVDEIFEVPLAYLMNGAHHQRRAIDLQDGAGPRNFYAMPFEQHFIWGATAAMLRNLFHFLRS